MVEELRLTLLGEPKVTRNGEPVTGFISTKAQALLYYLAVTGHPHSREVLAGLLWGEMPEAQARKNLTKALSNLRKLIGPCLIIKRQTASFNQNVPYWLDVKLFQSTLESDHPPKELEPLRTTAELYQGEFLAGFYVKDALAFEEWVLTLRQRFRELMLQALQILANQYTAREEYADAIDYTNQLLALDPWRESAHRQLMTLLARTGQRNAALAQYEACRRILADELGTEPMAETKALYDRLKAAHTLPAHNLPLQPTVFVGRKTELAQIAAQLDDPNCRLLTIVGPGGIGKTRLALQVAARYVHPETAFGAQGFPDGVYFISLAPLDSVNAILPTLAEALGFSFYEAGEPRQQLLDYLRQKIMFLILDNIEHLLLPPERGMKGGAELVVDILGTAPGIKLLTTSRIRLNVQGEYIFQVGGMDFPDGETLPQADLRPLGKIRDASEYSAIQLFLQRARQVQPDFELTASNVQDIAQVCRMVQGMPLGILLAAAWVGILTPAEIAAEIGQSLDFLETDLRDTPERQRSIRAAFDHSWNLLTKQEQSVFEKLSIFRGDFSHQAAQAVSGASLRELMALVNKSLLYRVPTGRFAVHELLRQYAVEKLDQSPDGGQAARDRHSAYYTAALQQLEADLKGPQQQTALAEIESNSENARAAWKFAVEQEQFERLEQAIESLGHFYLWRGRYHGGEAAFRIAAEKLTAASSGESLLTLAKLLTWQSIFSRQLGQTEIAKQLLLKSLALLDSSALTNLDVRSVQAFVLLQMGEIARESDRKEARRKYEQSLGLYQSVNDRWGTANVLASLGWLIQHLGAYDEAKQLYQESLAIRQGLQDQRGIATSLKSLGGIALYQGQHEEAERLIRQSISIHEELGDRLGIASSLSKLGETLTLLGRFAEALPPLEASKAIYNDLGLRDAVAFSDAMLGNAMTHLGRYEEVRTQARMALTLFRELGSERGIGYALLGLGWATLAMKTAADARQLLQESVSIYRELGQRDELGQALALLAYAAYKSGNIPQAQQYLFEAVRTATEIRAFMPLVLSLPAIALLLIERGEQERAFELYALASQYPLVANSRWFEDNVGRPIAALADTLPQELVLAARARGQARSLQSTLAEILNEWTDKVS